MGGPVQHVIALPFIWSGHVNPMLHLCKYLAASGCSVTLLKVPEHGEQLNGIKWDAGVKIISALPLSPPEIPPPASGENVDASSVVAAYVHNFQSLGDTALGVVQDVMSDGEGQISCILSDVLVGWSSSIAERLGVPWIALWTSTVSELLIYYHMPELISKGIFPFSGSPSEEAITCVPGIEELRPVDYPTLELIAKPAVRRMVHSFKDCVVHGLPKARIVLLNSVYELERSGVDAFRGLGINVEPVGPLHMLEARDELSRNVNDDKALKWLDDKPASSVLYVSFGTTMPAPAAQFAELASALEESGHHFLWSIREVSLLPPGFEEKLASTGQGLVVPFAPQLQVLSHPSIRGFFTHCGWNSVLETIGSGVPLVARPLVADQSLTRKLLRDWGNAVVLEGLSYKVTSAEEIKRAIRTLMGSEGQALKDKAQELKKLVIDAVNGFSSKKLQALVNDLK